MKKRYELYDKNGNVISTEEVNVSSAEYNEPILRQLQEIDTKSIRALREGNVERITALEDEAIILRQQLLTP